MRDFIKSAPAFTGLSEAGVEFLANAGKLTPLAAGEVLFHMGDAGGTLYLVADGVIDVVMPGAGGAETIVAQLHAGDVAGEIQMLAGGRRNSTLRANTAASLIGFNQDAFEHLAETEPAFIERIRQVVLARLRRNHLASILPAQFGELDFHQTLEIESLGRWLTLQKGQVLFHQGDAGDGACLLVSGLLGAMVKKPGGGMRLADYIPHGEMVGEMALLSDEPRAATVYAARESDLLFFGKREFNLLIEKYPRLLLGIARTNIARLRHSMSRARPWNKTSITALVAASPAVPMEAFARRLAEALAGYNTVRHVNRKLLQGILGAPDESAAAHQIFVNTRFPAWLCAEEGEHQIILLETAATDPHWTESCIRQADQVLTIGLAEESPALSDIEARCVHRRQDAGEVQKRLVLIHPDDCERPRGTARWLEQRHVEMHHHVRMGTPGDFQRLARFLTGSAVCLALGGGGARGFAHIGAIRALREERVPIDIVGGTSMGAVIGAELALGLPSAEMLRVNRFLFRNSGLVRDLTLPLLSFTTGKAYAGTLQDVFAEVEIEDLWIPYFCVSSNISRAERAIHRSGLVWRKVRASSGVQGMFPPVVIDGDLHVDGAPFANLPADAMKSVCQGKVIAVDVSPPVDLLRNTDYGEVVSGWKILWKKMFPGGEEFRCADLGTIMQRAGEAVSIANQKLTIEQMADYYLRLPVEEFGLFAFKALPKLEQLGYDYTHQKIAEWRAAGGWLQV